MTATEQTGLIAAGSAIIAGHEETGSRDGLALRVAFLVSPPARAKLNRSVGSGIKNAVQRVSKAARNSHDAEAIATSQARSGVVAEALRAARLELVEVERAAAEALSTGQLDEAGMVHVDRATLLKGRIKALSLEASRLSHETRQAETSARASIGRVVVEAVAEVERELSDKIATLEQRILAVVAEDLGRLLEAHAMLDQLKSSGRRLIESEATAAVLSRVVDR